MATMAFASIAGLTLHYRVEGLRGAQPLIFVNSLGTDLRIWDKVIDHLDGHFAFVRHDLRGHGLSDAPPGPYAIKDHTHDLDGLLDFLGVDQAVLVGISVGGMIALDFAIRYPQKTQALVVCNSAARIGSEAYWTSRGHSLKEHGMEQMAETIVSRWFGPRFAGDRPAEYRGYLNMFARMPLGGYAGTCAALGAADLRESVATIKARSLVLAGTDDQSTPPDLVRGLASSLPGARFALIEDAGHLTCVEQPEAVAVQIDRFLNVVR